MFVIIGICLGATFGALAARKRGGNRADIIQFAAVFAMIFGVIGLATTIGLHRILT